MGLIIFCIILVVTVIVLVYALMNQSRVLSEYRTKVGILSADTKRLHELCSIIQLSMSSTVMTVLGKNFVNDVDATAHEKDFHSLVSSVITTAITDAMTAPDIVIPAMVRQQAMMLMGDDAYNNFINETAEGIRIYLCDPIVKITDVCEDYHMFKLNYQEIVMNYIRHIAGTIRLQYPLVGADTMAVKIAEFKKLADAILNKETSSAK